ncbi:MAG TPA: mitochondrial fission ELM1 family protein [Thermohalobaculum sp.]|nr:mitochondrial fission ELM1 family protein [Thermohalobaculum sp.]
MESRADEEPVTIWALSDGRAGNRAQALGLAEALARRRPVALEEGVAEPVAGAAALPPRLWHLLGLGAPGRGFAEGALPGPPWPTLAIGAGRRVAPLVAWLGRQGVRTVQCLDPRMPAAAFDLVVAPAHDRLEGPNALATVGAVGRTDRARIEAEAARWRARMATVPLPRLAVLVGGPSRSARWRADTPPALAEALARLGAQGHGLMVTPSRRTPAPVMARIAEAVGTCAFVWNGHGDNPYPGLLGLADAVLVTEDSVNMASEAAATGKPVHLFPVGRVRPKFRRFHASLIARGAARPFEGRIERWTYQPLDEADRIAAEVARRLLPGDGARS